LGRGTDVWLAERMDGRMISRRCDSDDKIVIVVEGNIGERRIDGERALLYTLFLILLLETQEGKDAPHPLSV
jgi:hypothetical protein